MGEIFFISERREGEKGQAAASVFSPLHLHCECSKPARPFRNSSGSLFTAEWGNLLLFCGLRRSTKTPSERKKSRPLFLPLTEAAKRLRLPLSQRRQPVSAQRRQMFYLRGSKASLWEQTLKRAAARDAE